MDSMEEVRFRSLPSSLSLFFFPSLLLDVLWSRKRMEVKAVILDHIHKEQRYTHTQRETGGGNEEEQQEKEEAKKTHTQLWPRFP